MEDNVPAGVGIANVVEDTTPQLGGTLDSNAHQINWSKGGDVASANALVLGTDGNYFDITGTTAILSIGTLAIGTVVVLHFDGILTLTHQATDLILPGAANITTAAGDEAIFVEYATGDWRCVAYTKVSGEAIITTGYKKIYIPANSGYISANGTSNTVGEFATTRFPDAVTTYVDLTFQLPPDFSALTSVKAILIPLGTGNIYYKATSGQANVGEAYNGDTDSIAYTTIAATINNFLAVDITSALNSLTLNPTDFVGVKFWRDAANASDTVDTAIEMVGFEIIYS